MKKIINNFYSFTLYEEYQSKWRENVKEQYDSYKYKFIYIATDPFVK